MCLYVLKRPITQLKNIDSLKPVRHCGAFRENVNNSVIQWIMLFVEQPRLHRVLEL